MHRLGARAAAALVQEAAGAAHCRSTALWAHRWTAAAVPARQPSVRLPCLHGNLQYCRPRACRACLQWRWLFNSVAHIAFYMWARIGCTAVHHRGRRSHCCRTLSRISPSTEARLTATHATHSTAQRRRLSAERHSLAYACHLLTSLACAPTRSAPARAVSTPRLRREHPICGRTPGQVRPPHGTAPSLGPAAAGLGDGGRRRPRCAE